MFFKIHNKTAMIRNNRGFTLIEALIAIAIFSIGFLAAAAMQINALNKTNSARRVTEALTLAEDQVELLRAMPFYDDDEDLDGDGNVDAWDIRPDLTAASASNPHMTDLPNPYTVRWTVVDDEPLPAYDDGVLTEAPQVPPKRSKTIRVWVTRDNVPNDVQAEITFSKFWAADRM